MDKAKQTGWDFFPSKAFLNFIRFSAGEIVKLKLLPALYLFGGPLWHNACSPSTPFLILKQPGTLSGVTYSVR